MQFDFIGIFFFIVNVVLWIGIINVIIKFIKKIKYTFNKIDLIDKKVDSILDEMKNTIH